MDELLAATERLAHAVERAQIGEDKELAQEVRERGEQLTSVLYGVLKLVRLYSVDNSAFEQPVTECRTLLERMISRLGSVHIVTVEDQVYVNDVRVRFGERAGNQGALAQELKRHNCGGITFTAVPTDDHIRKLVQCFGQSPAADSPRAAVTRALAAAGVTELELVSVFRFPKVGEQAMKKQEPEDVIARAETALDAALSAAFNGRVMNALPLRRLVTEILTLDPETLEGMWQPPPETPPHLAHALRVNLVALTIGKAARLGEAVLQDLGVAALLHDLGYSAPPQLQEQAMVQLPHFVQHPIVGARIIVKQRGFHEGKVRRILSILHHHRDVNDPRGRPALFARILRIAEDYDNFSRHDGGRLSPAEALMVMAPNVGTRYDPTIFQLLVNTVGRFPPGTLLELEDGRVVETFSLVRDAETFQRPKAKVVRLPGGVAPSESVVVDLTREGRPKKLLRRLD